MGSYEVVPFPEAKPSVLIPEINVGTVGHVDHGKTSLVQALTGKWTDTHSEELKRGITIRLGYADAIFYQCKQCKLYGVSRKCVSCFSECAEKRAVSFIDAPGHETLMATVLSGASLMDGALLVIAANEKCPQPQTAEHLKALDVVGIRNIIIVQNKVDIVSKERAIESHNEIKAFVKGTVAEKAPVVPASAIHNVNIDALIEAIEAIIPTPKRDETKEPRFFAARSFDVNRPGTAIRELKGGVVGGSLVSGVLKVKDTIEIKPGVKVNDAWKPLETTIAGIIQSGVHIDTARPGGLVALQTELDPSLTKSDSLSGNIIGIKGKLPETKSELKFKVELFDHVVGIEGKQKVDPVKTGDVLMITVAIAKTVAIVQSAAKGVCQAKLKLPVCAEKSDKISISRQVGGRWHLIGYGIIL
ncbi:MAG: translation initiation factor IF-2 subunit gamma [Candidatus Aenigmarchaeota archaeon]|nr:translation initiation factor IF-2 subunit gamma [Candidatus Aenigmarchaeota archaeon]